MFKFFENVKTIEELKKQYRKLVFIHHPDAGGSTEIMQELNNEHDLLFNALKQENNSDTTNKRIDEMPTEYREVLYKIVTLEGLEIELCGSWIWLSGDTYKNKTVIKESGFDWSKTKKMWYWHHKDEDSNIFYRGRKTIDSIRKTYGSEKIKSEFKPKLK